MDKNQLKTEGLLFGRNLQRALKIAGMYASVDHSAVDLAAQETYNSLNPLLKQAREFTLGFMNHRLLLNNILSAGNPLEGLEAEFSKRGIGALTFQAGITQREFKTGLGVLSTAPKTIEKGGGIKRLIEQNRMPRIRVIPVVQPKGAGGDTVLGLDSESFLIAQGILEPQVGAGREGSLDLILQAAESDNSAGGTPGGPGGQGGQGGAAGSVDVAGAAGAGGPGAVLALAGRTVERALADRSLDLREALNRLTNMFQQLTPDYLLAALSPARQAQLRGRPAEEIATELVEDMTLEFVGKRLAGSAKGPPDPELVEELVSDLTRGLRATRVAERLLQKLGRFVEEAKLPAEVNDRIRQEVIWFSLTEQQKYARLLELDHFQGRDFRRLINYVQDRINDGKTAQAIEVTRHFFDCLDQPPDVAREQLARAPELLRVVAGPETAQFLPSLVERLRSTLLDEKRQDAEFHRQVANCLIGLAQCAGLYEDFKFIQSVAVNLQSSLGRDPARHAECCGRALESLLAPSTADRLVELYLGNREDSLEARTAAILLKLGGLVGADRAFERLAEEPAASNRFRLVRLIVQLGAAGIEAACKRLTDNRWYVARNACHVLGNLRDPDLSNHLRASLRHAEMRVQHAAVTALIKNQVADRAVLLADALPHLQGQVLDLSLDELTFLKDPATIESMLQFIAQRKTGKPGGLEKAVKVLSAIPSDRAVEALSKILTDKNNPPTIRRIALVALSCSSSPHAHRLLFKFSKLDRRDELVVECQGILGASKP